MGRGTRGRVAVVTGAASGIGAAIVGALAPTRNVLATDVDARALDARAAADAWPRDRVATHALDVRDAAAWERALDAAEARFGDVAWVLNVAGVLVPGRIDGLDPAAIELQLDVNVKGVVFGTRAAAARMIARGEGHVVNVGSLASLAPVPGLSIYTASKFAVRGFSLAVAEELRPHGVAVSLVMPDAVATPMLALQEDREEAALVFSGGRVLTAAEVARVVVTRVLATRPLEVTLPTARGLLARVANALPNAVRHARPLLTARGRRAQDAIRRARGGGGAGRGG